MIPLCSSCIKLVYVLVLSRATRSLFWTLRSERCVRRPNYGDRALLSERSAERSDPKIKWSGAERWAGDAEKRWSGAEREAGGRGAGTERGAEVTGLGWSVERLFRPLRSAHMLWMWCDVLYSTHYSASLSTRHSSNTISDGTKAIKYSAMFMLYM